MFASQLKKQIHQKKKRKENVITQAIPFNLSSISINKKFIHSKQDIILYTVLQYSY